ncbi:hypothetical protein N825_22195 [Skermanella stibiiresistens SB22]|uniref:TolB-like protein n=1 Tax=Skermanella stibiiresistens SB22 TaxID=1385369 RepID=W9GZV7_9PROT|nr:hypothetical protein [Skermanella stibiiresistens]EWY37023.1 hypothetical protein N825_22195 [Skermanella stibiiresistens SB22]
MADDRILEHLDQICSTEEFRKATRSRNFLRYVVNETLAGRTDRIKAYAIAVSVLGRDESFDPQVDPIVRIEAGQLRRRLERYYLTEGSASTLRIELPKGSYVPVFARVPSAGTVIPAAVIVEPDTFYGKRMRWTLPGAVLASAGLAWALLIGGPRAAMNAVPTMQVNAFIPVDASSADLASGLQDEVRRTLLGSRRLMVVDKRHAVSRAAPDFIMEGSVRLVDGRIRVNARVIDTRTATYVWARGYDGAEGDVSVLEDQTRIASDIVRQVALSPRDQEHFE